MMQVIGTTRVEAFSKQRPETKAALSALLVRLRGTEAATTADLAESFGAAVEAGDLVITLERHRVRVRVACDAGANLAFIRSVTALD